MLRCNGVDSNNMLYHESEQTSNWCLIAREFVEPSLYGKANDG